MNSFTSADCEKGLTTSTMSRDNRVVPEGCIFIPWLPPSNNVALSNITFRFAARPCRRPEGVPPWGNVL